MLASRVIKEFYAKYKDIDVLFNKNVILATGLVSKHTFIKYADAQQPCVLYSSSMETGKIFTALKSRTAEELKNGHEKMSLRLAFKRADSKNLLTFFVSSKIIAVSQYDSANINTIHLSYNPPIPDSLVEVLGELLEAKTNAEKRKEERITLNPSSIRRLGLESSNAHVWIEGLSQKCIIRDLSFVGTKILVIGNAKFVVEKEIALRLHFEGHQPFDIVGTVIRNEEIVGRPDAAAIGIAFNEKEIPALYTIRLNDFLKRQDVLKS